MLNLGVWPNELTVALKAKVSDTFICHTLSLRYIAVVVGNRRSRTGNVVVTPHPLPCGDLDVSSACALFLATPTAILA